MDTLLQQVGDEKGCDAGASPIPPTQPAITVAQADGWAVTLARRARLGGRWLYDLRYFDDWYEAQDCYENPPGEWQATRIHACKDGEPFARLSAHKIAQLRTEI